MRSGEVPLLSAQAALELWHGYQGRMKLALRALVARDVIFVVSPTRNPALVSGAININTRPYQFAGQRVCAFDRLPGVFACAHVACDFRRQLDWVGANPIGNRTGL